MASQSAEDIVAIESGAQLLARLDARPSLSSLEPALFPEVAPGEVIEIFGDSGSGKSELLYHFIARCIFPASWNDLPLNGLDASVLLVDTDYHFDIFRLINILERRLSTLRAQNQEVKVTQSEISDFIIQCLKFLSVVRCSSTEELIITLQHLKRTVASNNKISCLMIDSISAFYWIDSRRYAPQYKELDDLYVKLVTRLEQLIKDYALVIIAVRQDMKKTVPDRWSNENCFMGSVWQKFVTSRLRIALEKSETGRTTFAVEHLSVPKKEIQKIFVTDAGVQFE